MLARLAASDHILHSQTMTDRSICTRPSWSSSSAQRIAYLRNLNSYSVHSEEAISQYPIPQTCQLRFSRPELMPGCLRHTRSPNPHRPRFQSRIWCATTTADYHLNRAGALLLSAVVDARNVVAWELTYTG